VKKRKQSNLEGVWADPEAVLRPTEGERLASLIQEFQDEQYPQMMALGWMKQTLERLPENQTLLKGLVDHALMELLHETLALGMAMDQAHEMCSECTGEAAQAPAPMSMDAVEEEQRSQLAKICFYDNVDPGEDARLNTITQEWYSEKQAAAWIVKTLNMLPLDRQFSQVRTALIAARKALLRRITEIEEAVGFDLVMFCES